MKLLVESLKRLYEDKKITKEKIFEMHLKNLITDDERDYILDE